MCKSAAHHTFLATLPKCEHHVHIEGTLGPKLMFALAKRNGIALPQDDPSYQSEAALLDRYRRFTSLDDFLGYYYTAMSVLLYSSDFEALAWAYFETAASEGVAHVEISFDPQAHIERGVGFSNIVSGLTAARSRAEKELGISTNLICCFLRHLPPLDAAKLLNSEDFLSAVSSGIIAGIGLDSSENGFPPELFEEVYRNAKALGVRLTAHAGEEGPAANIDSALRILGVERIDHGIRLADDASLMRKVAQVGVMLTVCPVSNVRLRAAASIDSLPVRAFLDANVKFSINSDDPAYFGASLLGNYCAIQDSFNLTSDEWELICATAISGSWCGEQRKAELLEMLSEAKRKYG